jgi:hypothetical protein
MRHDRIRPEDMVSNCYSIEVYMQAYGKAVMPCRDRIEWTRTNGPDVLHPFYEKKVGMPKRCRRKDPEENEAGTKISKHGVKMHCGYCRSPNHTKRNCADYKADVEAGIAFPPEQRTAKPVPTDEVTHEEVAAEPVPAEQVPEQVLAEQVPAEQVPEQVQEVQEQVVGKRRRRPSLKKMEQQEASAACEARKKRATCFDENGDIDVPELLTVSSHKTIHYYCHFNCSMNLTVYYPLQHIIPKNLVPSHDPVQLPSSMVYKLAHEVPTCTNRVAEPLPEESWFVAEHRNAIPESGRVSIALTDWTIRTRGTRARGTRARGTKARGRVTVVQQARGRAKRGYNKRKRGARWLLLGDDGQSTSQPQEEYQSSYQINTTQGAPGDYSE